MNLDKLMETLGYVFKNVYLLDMAITHRSVSTKHNERLEFLGDAILCIAVSDWLYSHFPDFSEGKMSQVRSNIVNRRYLNNIAKKIKLGDYIKIRDNKESLINNSFVLSNALEAIFGAMFIDSDFEICCATMVKILNINTDVVLGSSHKDSKTLLQEYAQKNKILLPSYTVIEVFGEPHNHTFLVECAVVLKERITGIGQAKNIRSAEQIAAKDAMFKLIK